MLLCFTYDDHKWQRKKKLRDTKWTTHVGKGCESNLMRSLFFCIFLTFCFDRFIRSVRCCCCCSNYCWQLLLLLKYQKSCTYNAITTRNWLQTMIALSFVRIFFLRFFSQIAYKCEIIRRKNQIYIFFFVTNVERKKGNNKKGIRSIHADFSFSRVISFLVVNKWKTFILHVSRCDEVIFACTILFSI